MASKPRPPGVTMQSVLPSRHGTRALGKKGGEKIDGTDRRARKIFVISYVYGA